MYTSTFNYIEIMKPLWLLKLLLQVIGNGTENAKLLLCNFYLILNSDFYGDLNLFRKIIL